MATLPDAVKTVLRHLDYGALSAYLPLLRELILFIILNFKLLIFEGS